MERHWRYAKERQAEIIALIREMVECESPSDEPGAVNRMVDLIVERTRGLAVAKMVRADGYGKHLRLEFKLAGKKGGQILALGHSDTVWPMGTLKTMPFRSGEGRLWGPGVLDMKAGLAFFIFAMKALREMDVAVKWNVVMLVVSDEETGSKTSRELTETEAKASDCVLVLEPGTGLEGKLKTARKGVGTYTVFVEGRASHAGVDFSAGANAIVEVARQIEKIAGFTDLVRGTTVNPGVVSGGTRTNVVASKARVEVDVRTVRQRDAEALDRKFRKLRAVDERCSLRVEGGTNRPPMERTKAISKLFQRAKKLGAEIGLTLEESSTGGGSDGNFTAALGVPTLDGLGAVGEGAHAVHESILIDRIADRVALLAALVVTGRDA